MIKTLLQAIAGAVFLGSCLLTVLLFVYVLVPEGAL